MTMCRCCWASLQRCGWVQLMRIWFQDISSEQLLLKSCWLMITRAYNGLYYRTIYIYYIGDYIEFARYLKWIKKMSQRYENPYGPWWFHPCFWRGDTSTQEGWNPPLCHKMRRMVTEFPYSGIQRTVGAVRQISELKFLRNRDASALVLKSFFLFTHFSCFLCFVYLSGFFWVNFGEWNSCTGSRKREDSN